MKITRRTQLLVVALVLCMTTMIGSTLAWFTDTVEVTGNNIQSGTLDVEMKWAKGTEDPATTTWTDASTGAIFNYDKWEPGYVEVRHVEIKNAGTLALKYDLKLVPTGEVSELAEVIDVYYADPAVKAENRALAGMTKIGTLADFIEQNADNSNNTASGNLQANTNHTVTIALKMQESAGNEYQSKTIGTNFNLVLNATQLMSEEDSFGNTYDEEAKYNPILKATFADNEWEDIIYACQNNVVPSTWQVGDKKTMTINGAEYTIAIIGKNHDSYSDGSGTAPLTFQLAEVYGTTAKMNETQTNTTGWSGSAMRTTTMPEILAAMPSEVQAAIKEVDKKTLNGTRDSLETTSDKLFLLSEIEVNGSKFFSNNFEEGAQYAYYAEGGSNIMSATWWLRGPGKSNDIGYTQINMSGYMANGSAEYACGVVFGFCF